MCLLRALRDDNEYKLKLLQGDVVRIRVSGPPLARFARNGSYSI